MTMEEPGWAFKDAEGFPGYAKLPAGKESYLIDFLMAMLTPKGSGNPNEFYFSPKTGGFIPAVKAQSPVVIKAVMRMLDSYNVTPNKNELLASKNNLEEIKKIINAKTLKFLSIEGLYKSMGYEKRILIYLNPKILESSVKIYKALLFIIGAVIMPSAIFLEYSTFPEVAEQTIKYPLCVTA